VTGELAGAEAERRIGRALFGAYLRRADLRRRGPRIFANEATLGLTIGLVVMMFLDVAFA